MIQDLHWIIALKIRVHMPVTLMSYNVKTTVFRPPLRMKKGTVFKVNFVNKDRIHRLLLDDDDYGVLRRRYRYSVARPCVQRG